MTVLSTIGFGIAIGALVGGGFVLYRKNQERLERRWQEELRKIARSRRLSILDGDTPRHLYERVQDIESPGRFTIRDAMVGRDDSGSYYFARRVERTRSIQMLLFDANKDTRIDGFTLAPRRHSARGGAWTRWLGELFGRKSTQPVSIELGWRCRPAELLQEGLLERATQTMRAVADACHRSSGTALGIHVDGKRVVIFTEGYLDTGELDQFMRQSLELRFAALSVLLDLRHLGSATGAVRPISDAIREVAAQNLKRRTAPVSKAVDRQDRASLQNSGAWSMPMDVPPDNERYKEEVVIYTSRGIPLDS